MSRIADWYLGQIIVHGWAPVLAAQILLWLAVLCGTGAALNAEARHKNTPEPAREEKP